MTGFDRAIAIAAAGFFALAGSGAASAKGAAAHAVRARAAIVAVPAASVRVTSGSVDQSNWHGQGDNVSSFDLCITSTTGRYRLQVSNLSDGKLIGRSANLPYELRFVGPSGARQVASAGSGLIVFSGNTNASEQCDMGPNARLEIAAPEKALLGSVAGDYIGRLEISATPL